MHGLKQNPGMRPAERRTVENILTIRPFQKNVEGLKRTTTMIGSSKTKVCSIEQLGTFLMGLHLRQTEQLETAL